MRAKAWPWCSGPCVASPGPEDASGLYALRPLRVLPVLFLYPDVGGPLGGAAAAPCQCSRDGSSQVYRCGHRRRCYPPSWQRWAFYLLPGISMAAVAIAIYASMMTSDNYYYTHSIWHMLLAGSTAFLLPPRDQHAEPWACSRGLPCHYQICKNHREELYTVT